MKLRNRLFIAAVAITGIVGGGTLLHAAVPDDNGSSHTVAAKHGGHGGWYRQGGGHMMHVCATGHAERGDRMIALVDRFAELNDDQRLAWDDLSDALRSASSAVKAACATVREQGRPQTSPERLARMEFMLDTIAEAVRTVRPPYEVFYTLLDSDQQAALDDVMQHRRTRGHHRHRGEREKRT